MDEHVDDGTSVRPQDGRIASVVELLSATEGMVHKGFEFVSSCDNICYLTLSLYKNDIGKINDLIVPVKCLGIQQRSGGEPVSGRGGGGS